MKKIFTIIVLSISSCASLTLVSPGITSEHRLNNNSSIKFEEAAFYGSNFYQLNSFYIENENINLVLNDPNNILNSKYMEDFEKNITENDFLLLTEICFDEEKFKEKILDLDLYDFELNGNMFTEKIEFIYPYSYISKGNRFNLERPLLIHDNYPNQHKVIKTADNFVTCSRSILKFKKEFQIEGKNILKIVTPRKSNIYFQFHIKNSKFEIQNIEEMDIKLKVKSEA